MNFLHNRNRIELYTFLLETQINNANNLKIKGWKNLHQANSKNQEAGVITITD